MVGLFAVITMSFWLGPNSETRSARKPMKLLSLETQIEEQVDLGEDMDVERVHLKIAKLLRQAPLNDDALVYYGKSLMSQQSREDFDPTIFEIVKSRNPRNRKNLNAILLHALQGGDSDRALDVIDVMYRLDQRNRPALLKVVNSIYNVESGYNAVNSALANRPMWELSFLQSQAQNVTPSNIEKIGKTIALSINLSEDVSLIKPYVGRLLNGLIEAGDTETAYTLWETATRKAEKQNSLSNKEEPETLNYNPTILDIASPAPFNWAFFPTKDTLIEDSVDGVYFSFAGGESKTVARQYFLPQPGSFKLTIKANYRYTDRQGHFSVNLQCVAPWQPHIETKLDTAVREKPEVSNVLDGFDENCSLATLTLIANPGIFSDRIAATFNYIAVEPLEAVQ